MKKCMIGNVYYTKNVNYTLFFIVHYKIIINFAS